MKPKENKGYTVGAYDNCQTPPYALEPLLPYINPLHLLWECAAGGRVLARALTKLGYNVLSTDINDPVGNCNFFDVEPANEVVQRSRNYTIVTNPPYSIKYEWLKRCFELGRPFALLLPIETIGSKKAQDMFRDRDIRIIFMSPRVDFLMPEMGYEGGGAQFPTAWFTYGFALPKELNYAILRKPKKKDLPGYWRSVLNE